MYSIICEIRELNCFIEVNKLLKRGWVLLGFNLRETRNNYLVGRVISTNGNREAGISAILVQTLNSGEHDPSRYIPMLLKPITVGKALI